MHLENLTMAERRDTIHIVPDENFDDWIVREGTGREFGHYATREAAELVAEPLAKERGSELVIHLPGGGTNRKSFANWWLLRLLGR